jgi:(S)-2-hydroxyglutarate dehydrogenase
MALARELNSRLPAADILVIEKEPDVAYHGSGRNSGVLHAGFLLLG